MVVDDRRQHQGTRELRTWQTGIWSEMHALEVTATKTNMEHLGSKSRPSYLADGRDKAGATGLHQF